MLRFQTSAEGNQRSAYPPTSALSLAQMPPHTLSFRTTASELSIGIMVAADCSILDVLPMAAPVIRQHLTPQTRILALNNAPMKDRCELRECLNNMAPNAVVEVEYMRSLDFFRRVEISDSVQCNGSLSSLAPIASLETSVFDDDLDCDAVVPVPTTSSWVGLGGSSSRQAKSGVSPQRHHRFPSPQRGGGLSMLSTMPDGDCFEQRHLSICSQDSGMGHSQSQAQPFGVSDFSDSPAMLAFEAVGESMDSTIRAKESSEVHHATIRHKVFSGVSKVKPGRCVICVCVDVNPVAEIELLALTLGQTLNTVNLGAKLRHRPTPEVIAALLGDAMSNGKWFVLLNAHKSINTLRHLQQLLEELDAHSFAGVHPGARCIICTEPHPHFPPYLTHGAVLTKIHATLTGSSLMEATLRSMTSTTRCRLVQAALPIDEGVPVIPSPSSQPSSNTQAKAPPFSPILSAASEAPPGSPVRKRVRLSAAVEIVDIEPRDLLCGINNNNTNNSSMRSARSSKPIDVSGSVSLRHTFTGVFNDKFLSITRAGMDGRFAVTSSLGNIYFLDNLGNSLLQVHAHDSCIWDAAFHTKFDFATASEEGTAAVWTMDANPEVPYVLPPALGSPRSPFDSHIDAAGTTATSGDDGTDTQLDANYTKLQQKTTLTLGSDAYCVTNVSMSGATSLPVWVVGGLTNHVFVQYGDTAETMTTTTCPISSNAQALVSVPQTSKFLVGGGDGTISLLDVSSGGCSVVTTLNEHSRKVPTLTVRDHFQFFSGSFDSTIRAWDSRSGSCHATHTLKLKHFATGICVDEVYLAASVGENLYLWDVRKLDEVLGGYPQGWKGLSRGIVVDADDKLVVTASPDGQVRFWNFV